VKLDLNQESNLQTIYDRYDSMLKAPRTRVTDYNRYQLLRLKKMSEEISGTQYSVTVTSASGGNYWAEKLFDNNINSWWDLQSSQKEGGKWYVEFETSKPIKPETYSLRFPSSGTLEGGLPKSWRLTARRQGENNWYLIDERTNDSSAKMDGQAHIFTFNKWGGQTWKYFRLEVSESRGNSRLIISDFWFNFY
jgi:hypothetical protein